MAKAKPTNAWRLFLLGVDSPWRARRYVGQLIWSPLIRLRLRSAGVRVGKRTRFFGAPLVRRYRGSVITIGKNAEFRSKRDSNVLGLAHPVMLTTLAKDARIDIGEGARLSGASLCAMDRIHVGAAALIGADVLITDCDHHQLSGPRPRFSSDGVKSSPVWIGRDAFVGARAIILKGSKIGDGAILGAGSVLAGEIPAHAIAAGNPARVIGHVTDEATLAVGVLATPEVSHN